MAKKGLVGSYVPSQLTIAISHPQTNSNFILAGYTEDSIISVERENPTWESTEGADGYHQRTHRLSKTVRITVSLLQVSEYNDFLSGLVMYDENDLRGGGLFTCTVADKSGRSYAMSNQAYVVEPSSYESSQTATSRDWVIVLPYADHYIGGNVPITVEQQEQLARLGVVIEDDWIRG